MSGIYKAERYCDSCCRIIVANLIHDKRYPNYWSKQELALVLANNGNASEAVVWADSEDWPTWGYPNNEPSDSPQHCGQQDLCPNRIDLRGYGLLATSQLVGGETRYVGAIISGLSLDGISYVKGLRTPQTDYQRAIYNLWHLHYSDYIA